MKINVSNIDKGYATTTWHSIEFAILGRDGEFNVTITEMYDANADYTLYELTSTDDRLTNTELENIRLDLLEALGQESQ